MNGLCDKLISDNDAENMPQKEIPLYMPKDRTKNYNMSYEGKCFESGSLLPFGISLNYMLFIKECPVLEIIFHNVLHACVIL